MEKINARINSNGKQEYYVASTGRLLTNIGAISLADQEEAVFTVFKREGKLVFHCPVNGRLTLVSIYDAIHRYGKTVYLVSATGVAGGMQ